MLCKKNRTDCVTFGHVQLIPISGLKQNVTFAKSSKNTKTGYMLQMDDELLSQSTNMRI